jgi:hypothetical protein
MVLTGVSSARDAIEAAADWRPTYIGHDLRSLHEEADRLAIAGQPGWRVQINGTTVTVHSERPDIDADGLSIVRAVARAVWDADVDRRSVTVESGDDTARDALQRWSLLADS